MKTNWDLYILQITGNNEVMVSLWLIKYKNPVILCEGAGIEGPDRRVAGD